MIVYYSWRRHDHFKLSAHFLDLLGLLVQLTGESLNLLLLLRDLLLLLPDGCFQRLNLFVEHGLVLHARARGGLKSATRRWYAALRRVHSCVAKSGPAKVVVSKV